MPFFSDKLGHYKMLKKYCYDNGLKVNFIISELIQDYLVQVKAIPKK